MVILAHIPPASHNCVHSWTVRFKALVERYQHVIRMQLYGHTHREFFNLHRGFDDMHPLSMQWGVSSIGVREGFNPSFTIMHLDSETLLPVKVDRHHMDLRKSNELGSAQWSKMYEVSEEYGLKDLSPSSFMDLTSSWT